MGNQNCSLDDTQDEIQRNSFSNLQIEEQITDEAYGDAQIVRDNVSKQLYAIKMYSFSSKQELQLFVNRMQRIKKYSNNNLLGIKKLSLAQSDDLCANSYKLYVMIEYLQRDLHTEFIYRQLYKEIPFSIQEFLLILQSLVSALAYLQIHKRPHGRLNLKSIFTSDKGEIKLLDSVFVCKGSLVDEYIQQMPDWKKDIPYVSPSQMQLIANYSQRHRQNIAQNNHYVQTTMSNPYKNDVFVLGYIMLQLGTNSNFKDAFDFNTFIICPHTLAKHLSIIKQIYGQQVYSILQQMLNFSDEVRPDFIELAQLLGVIQQQQSESIKLVDNKNDLPFLLLKNHSNHPFYTFDQHIEERQNEQANILQFIELNNQNTELIHQHQYQNYLKIPHQKTSDIEKKNYIGFQQIVYQDNIKKIEENSKQDQQERSVSERMQQSYKNHLSNNQNNINNAHIVEKLFLCEKQNNIKKKNQENNMLNSSPYIKSINSQATKTKSTKYNDYAQQSSSQNYLISNQEINTINPPSYQDTTYHDQNKKLCLDQSNFIENTPFYQTQKLQNKNTLLQSPSICAIHISQTQLHTKSDHVYDNKNKISLQEINNSQNAQSSVEVKLQGLIMNGQIPNQNEFYRNISCDNLSLYNNSIMQVDNRNLQNKKNVNTKGSIIIYDTMQSSDEERQDESIQSGYQQNNFGECESYFNYCQTIPYNQSELSNQVIENFNIISQPKNSI